MPDRTSWSLSDWNAVYTANPQPMSREEIDSAIKYLRDSNYPKPEDCPEDKCPKYRPACQLGICNIAVGMCGDF